MSTKSKSKSKSSKPTRRLTVNEAIRRYDNSPELVRLINRVAQLESDINVDALQLVRLINRVEQLEGDLEAIRLAIRLGTPSPADPPRVDRDKVKIVRNYKKDRSGLTGHPAVQRRLLQVPSISTLREMNYRKKAR